MPGESPRSTLKFSAQTRSYELKVSDNVENFKTPSKSSSRLVMQPVYSVLPRRTTPVRKPVRNPFNDRLEEVLNRPTCSPNFCLSFASPNSIVEKEDKNEFHWTVEDLWRIHPVPIDSPQTDVEDNLDEETESLAQEAIERYFQESHDIRSPSGSPKSLVVLDREVTPDLSVPHCPSDRAMSTPCTRFSSRNLKSTTSVQTDISFCSDIPDRLLELLKPHMNCLDDMKISETSVSNLSGLRRKLLFDNFYRSSDSDDEASIADDDEASIADKRTMSRFHPADWTPDRVSSTAALFSKSPDISPIGDAKTKQRNCFNFTREMAIDSITSPIRGTNASQTTNHHMSIDFEEVTIDSVAASSKSGHSADTGYNTYFSDRLDGSADRTHPVAIPVVTTCDIGLTSTPAINRCVVE